MPVLAEPNIKLEKREPNLNEAEADNIFWQTIRVSYGGGSNFPPPIDNNGDRWRGDGDDHKPRRSKSCARLILYTLIISTIGISLVAGAAWLSFYATWGENLFKLPHNRSVLSDKKKVSGSPRLANHQQYSQFSNKLVAPTLPLSQMPSSAIPTSAPK